MKKITESLILGSLIFGMTAAGHNVIDLKLPGKIYNSVNAMEEDNHIYIQGDIDNNGVINTGDLVFLIKGITNKEQISSSYFDVNFDSFVNSADLILLKKIVIGSTSSLEIKDKNNTLICFPEKDTILADEIYRQIKSDNEEVKEVLFSNGKKEKILSSCGILSERITAHKENTTDEIDITINVHYISGTNNEIPLTTTNETTKTSETGVFQSSPITSEPPKTDPPAPVEPQQPSGRVCNPTCYYEYDISTSELIATYYPDHAICVDDVTIYVPSFVGGNYQWYYDDNGISIFYNQYTIHCNYGESEGSILACN